MNKPTQSLILIFFLLNISACVSTPKTEADQYDKMTESTIFKTYQKLSIEAMKPVVEEYDKKLLEDNKPPVGKTHVHALLGLIWVTSSQPKYALAESEYSIEHARDPRDRYAVLAIQALALHEQGWHYLANQKSAEANALVQDQSFSNRYNNMLILVHLAGSSLALQQGNIAHSINSIREVGMMLNEDWVVELADSAQESYSGSRTKAIAKLEQLKNDSSLSAHERNAVDNVLQIALTSGKDISEKMTESIVSMVLDLGVKANPLTPLVLEELPEKYRNKLAGYLI